MQAAEIEKQRATHLFRRRSAQSVFAAAVSLVCVIYLVRTTDWREALHIFRTGVSLSALFWFALLAAGIVIIYGLRWRLLVGARLGLNASFVGAILCLGGNMFLPARGGDLLRVHYTHKEAEIPYAEVISKLVVEKVLDLGTLILVGIAAILFLQELSKSSHFNILLSLLGTSLLLVALAAIVLRYFAENLLTVLRPAFRLARVQPFFETHIVHLVRDAGFSMSLSNMFAPCLLSLAMWILLYAPAYILVAHFVGVSLSYREALFVLFAGTMGLMIPAAPSGIGTFHASVVSAFVFLGRPAAEGLLLATAVHFLFFVAYVIPAALVLARWRLTHFKPKVSP